MTLLFPIFSYLCRPNSIKMPKVKTHSRAKKTFKVTGTGKIKRFYAFKSHLLTKKTTKRKRHLRGSSLVHKTNLNMVKRLLTLR